MSFPGCRTRVSRGNLQRPRSSWRTRRSHGLDQRRCGYGARPWASASLCATSLCTRPNPPCSPLTRYARLLPPSLLSLSLTSHPPSLVHKVIPFMGVEHNLPSRLCGATRVTCCSVFGLVRRCWFCSFTNRIPGLH